MSWERFSYICRKANVNQKTEETISECLSRINKEGGTKLYGSELVSDSLPEKILDRIVGADQDIAKKAIKTYGELNFIQRLEEPIQFKRIMAYLGYVVFVFYGVVVIYQLKVAPTFLEVFDNFHMSKPIELVYFKKYSGLVVFVVTFLLGFNLLIGYKIKKLFRFKGEMENSPFIKYLAFKKIRTSYINICEIIKYPVSFDENPQQENRCSLRNHLDEVVSCKMDLVLEMEALLEQEFRTLISACEKQMKVLYVLVALIIVFAIFQFLASAYSPIFVMGEVI